MKGYRYFRCRNKDNANKRIERGDYFRCYENDVWTKCLGFVGLCMPAVGGEFAAIRRPLKQRKVAKRATNNRVMKRVSKTAKRTAS